ncbi:amidohydrolase family protein, partial [Bacteroidales bacterium AH-315-I05]|nr:amidohydrolase family protein [Bacteroidales bacterium AH-315-I05]
HPIGTLSKGMKGTDLSEMYDMHLAGAVAFSDDKQSIANPELLKRTLLYAKGFGGLVMSFPNDKNIALNGNVNEEKTATMLGLKGIPALAEELAISRDLFLAEYTNAPIHFSTVSTAKSVELIRQAKKKGLNVTAEVTAHHLLLDDSALLEFDSNCKVMPPLRTKNDIKALIKGLKDGTIDAICSDHCPEDEESKKREFEHATFGIIGLETAFAVAMTALSKMLSLEEIIQKMAIRPREILRIKTPVIKEGETANLTLFNPTVVWTPTEKDIRSKSRNTPFIGTKLTGKALGIYNKGKFSEC